MTPDPQDMTLREQRQAAANIVKFMLLPVGRRRWYMRLAGVRHAITQGAIETPRNRREFRDLGRSTRRRGR